MNMAVTLRYFSEFDKPAFQHITASARIELIGFKSGEICVRNQMQGFQCYLLLIYRLSFALPLLYLF